MKYILIGFVLLSFVFQESRARSYYFSSSIGDDDYTSDQVRNPNTPWKSIDKLNQSMSLLEPGDSILFKRGDIFMGQIVVTCSGTLNNSIIFGAYGNGDFPIITAALPITQWSNIDENIWIADCPQLDILVTNFFIDGVSQQIGRYPNSDAPNSGYLKIDSFYEKNQITSSSLSDGVDWTGGEGVIRTRRWLLDRLPITSHVENTLNFGTSTSYEMIDSMGFFIQNHPQTLDVHGEWYFKSINKKLYLYSTANPSDLSIEATAFNNAIFIDFQKSILVTDLDIRASIGANLLISNSSNIVIENCKILNAGTEGIVISWSSGIKVLNNVIDETNNNAIIFDNCNLVDVRSNKIFNTGLKPGMNKLGFVHQFHAIYIDADVSNIENNIIDSVGYSGIFFLGDSVLVKNNCIKNYCMSLEDGGGIHTYNSEKKVHSLRKIDSNFIINGIGASDGTEERNGLSLTYGVFCDYGSDHVVIINNTIEKSAGFGIFNSFGNHISIIGNTVYDNFIQLVFSDRPHDVPAPITHCLVRNNIFFSKYAYQMVAQFSETVQGAIANYGVFNNNYYCRPIKDYQIFEVYNYWESPTSAISTLLDLKSWQGDYMHDMASNSSPYILPTYSVGEVIGSNLLVNGTFQQDITGWNCWSNYSNCNIFWESNSFLDSGCLGLRFSGPSNQPNGELQGIGNCLGVVEGQDYILRFSMISSTAEKNVRISLRNGVSPYNEISNEGSIVVNRQRQEYELLFKSNSNVESATMNFIIDEDDETYWIDNIELYEANINVSLTEDSIVFLTNLGSEKEAIFDNNYYIDAKGGKLHNFDLYPHSSLILLKVDQEDFENAPSFANEYFLVVYPSPVGNRINVMSNYLGEKTVQIIDVAGRIYFEEKHGSQCFSIEGTNLPRGIYFLKFMGESGVISSKFIAM